MLRIQIQRWNSFASNKSRPSDTMNYPRLLLCAVSLATLATATLATAAPLAAQPPLRADPALAATLDSLAHGFRGRVGIYVRHLPTGAGYARNADSVFPTASLIKIPILLTLYEQVEQGRHDLEARLPYPDTLTYAYTESTDVVGYMAAGDTLPLRTLAFLMLTLSDNHASLWIQALVGGGAEVNRWLEAHGYARTRVNSRTPGREQARSRYGWGQTTPREIAEAMVSIREGRAVSPQGSEAMYRMLSGSYWNAEALSQVPPTVQTASKQGFVDRSRSEVLLVSSAGGDYVVAVITADQEDTSYARDNEGHRLIRAVSRAVYAHFNPDDAWRPMRER
jgi:beta-lactamase class A